MKTTSLKYCLVALLSVSFGVEVDAQPTSEVLNFGFETGDFTDWGFVFPTAAVVADNGPSAPGSNAGAITTLGIFGGFEQYIAKSVAITPGELLDFSFDYKTLPSASGKFTVQLRYWDGVGENGFSDGGGGSFLGEHNSTLDTTNGLWVTKSLTGLPSPSPEASAATYIDIRFIANAFNIFDGTVLGDNFILHGESTPGDFDEDGDVDGNDFLAWQQGGSPVPLSASDLTEWETNYGNVTAVSALSVVPEPTSLALVLLTLAGFASLPRRMQKEMLR